MPDCRETCTRGEQARQTDSARRKSNRITRRPFRKQLLSGDPLIKLDRMLKLGYHIKDSFTEARWQKHGGGVLSSLKISIIYASHSQTQITQSNHYWWCTRWTHSRPFTCKSENATSLRDSGETAKLPQKFALRYSVCMR